MASTISSPLIHPHRPLSSLPVPHPGNEQHSRRNMHRVPKLPRWGSRPGPPWPFFCGPHAPASCFSPSVGFPIVTPAPVYNPTPVYSPTPVLIPPCAAGPAAAHCESLRHGGPLTAKVARRSGFRSDWGSAARPVLPQSPHLVGHLSHTRGACPGEMRIHGTMRSRVRIKVRA